MSDAPRADTRTQGLERAISYSLRAGVICSLVLIVGGLILTVVQRPESLHASVREALGSGEAPFKTWASVIGGVLNGDGQALVMLGVLVLISTPVTRVGVSIGLFAIQKDRVFVCITLAVFLFLILSFLLGRLAG